MVTSVTNTIFTPFCDWRHWLLSFSIYSIFFTPCSITFIYFITYCDWRDHKWNNSILMRFFIYVLVSFFSKFVFILFSKFDNLWLTWLTFSRFYFYFIFWNLYGFKIFLKLFVHLCVWLTRPYFVVLRIYFIFVSEFGEGKFE